MKRKFMGFLTVFALAICLFATSDSASANTETNQSAPDTYFFYGALPNFGTIVFYQYYHPIYKAQYRGYISTSVACSTSYSECDYTGTLYRSPLPYPTPYSIEIEEVRFEEASLAQ